MSEITEGNIAKLQEFTAGKFVFAEPITTIKPWSLKELAGISDNAPDGVLLAIRTLAREIVALKEGK